MKVALVHDFLYQDGGAERVLEALHEMWPEAPIYTLFHNKKKIQRFKHADVRESFLKYLPFGRTYYRWYLPLMPYATEKYDLSEYDVVISSASAFAKGILTKPETLHICYCHTPTRYLWTDTHEYIEDLRLNSLIKKALLPRLIHKLRLWDKMSVDRVDQFIANSRSVQQRIKKYYRRDSDIIYPPVDIGEYTISDRQEDYFVTGGRIVPYKRFDLVVEVFNRLGTPLKIFGDGPELETLKKQAKSNIEFLGRISEEEKYQLLSKARAFIHPQLEDFGITPLESMACGRPVIAYGTGGATETVIPQKTGVLFFDQTWEALLHAIVSFDETQFNPREIRAWAERFDKEKFKAQMKQYVERRFEEFQQGTNQCSLDQSYHS